MTAVKRFALAFALACLSFSVNAHAQTPSIEVSTDNEAAEFSVQGSVREARVEIFAPSGEMIFESEATAGQPIVWRMVDVKGERVADGLYLATITIVDFTGKRRKRIEQVGVSNRPQPQSETASASEPPTPTAIGTITGEGTPGKIAKFNGANNITNSVLTESAGQVAINAATPTATLQVNALQPVATAGNGTNAPPYLFKTSGGKGGATTGTTGQKGGAGSNIFIVAGSGGNAPAGSTNGNGGFINIQPGVPGAGAGAIGLTGTLLLAPGGGNVGIGTGVDAPTSKLTVKGGDIEIVSFGRGLKFADGSVQTEAGLENVQHGATLSGAGTASSPLNIAVPLSLSGSSTGAILRVTNNNTGPAISAEGAIDTSLTYKIQGVRILSALADHTFVGVNVGTTNTGAGNSFFGSSAGAANTEGGNNSFFGASTGDTNTTGNSNTIIGASADVGSANLTNATAIGARARVTQNNSLVLGSISGQNGATANTSVGIGTTAPAARLHVRDNNGNILLGHAGCAAGFVGLGFGPNLSGCNNYALLGNGTDTFINRSASGALRFRENNVTQMVLAAGGNLGIGTLSPAQKLEVSGGAVLSSGTGGGAFVANNPNNQAAALRLDWSNNTARIRYGGNGAGAENGFVIQGQGDATKLRVTDAGNVVAGGSLFSSDSIFLKDLQRPVGGSGSLRDLCVEEASPSDGLKLVRCDLSSLRYKTDVRSFTPGLEVVSRLRPVSFRWKSGESTDFGLVAEEVAGVAPLLATHNEKGEVDGVRYNRVGVVLINAIKEQQAQIREQQKQIEQLQAQLDQVRRTIRRRAARR